MKKKIFGLFQNNFFIILAMAPKKVSARGRKKAIQKEIQNDLTPNGNVELLAENKLKGKSNEFFNTNELVGTEQNKVISFNLVTKKYSVTKPKNERECLAEKPSMDKNDIEKCETVNGVGNVDILAEKKLGNKSIAFKNTDKSAKAEKNEDISDNLSTNVSKITKQKEKEVLLKGRSSPRKKAIEKKTELEKSEFIKDLDFVDDNFKSGDQKELLTKVGKKTTSKKNNKKKGVFSEKLVEPVETKTSRNKKLDEKTALIDSNKQDLIQFPPTNIDRANSKRNRGKVNVTAASDCSPSKSSNTQSKKNSEKINEDYTDIKTNKSKNKKRALKDDVSQKLIRAQPKLSLIEETSADETELESKKISQENTKEKLKSNTSPSKKNSKKKKLKRKYDKIESEVKEIKENKSEYSDVLNETKVLKVTLDRNKAAEELILKQQEEESKLIKTLTGGSKRKKGNEASDILSSSAKPSKIPKTTKSKGQSKKDKMPDTTILDFSNKSTSSTGKSWNFKLSSWNVNGVRAWLEKNGLSYLHHESPDIICLQETKCSDDKLPKDVNVKGYHSYWLAGDKDGYSGVGLLSKVKPISVNYGIGIEDHDKEGRAITAEFEKFYLVTTYVPNAGRNLVRLEYRMQWDKDFRSYLKKLDEVKPVILCGDLNVAHEEIDLANPKTNKKNAGFTIEERNAFSALLAEGFIDTFRHLYPDEKAAYTFWTYMMNARAKNVGWRLDYFVMSERFVEYLCDHVIRKDVYGSDHCPITLFLSI